MRKAVGKWRGISGLLAVALCCGPAAMAAEQAQGDTSGPAAGKQTTPSTAVQKNTPNSNPSVAAGAPGVAAKPGSEAGRQPTDSNGQHVNH